MTELNRYTFAFRGRHAGAIGIMHPCHATVFAKDKDAAALKLYDTFDHITGLCLVDFCQWQLIGTAQDPDSRERDAA